MPVVAPHELRGYLARIFEATGTPADDAAEVAGHLVEANLKGHDSHGAIRTVHYVVSVQEGRTRPAAAIEVERETLTTAVVNGNWNFGQVVAREAMRIAIAKARAQGLAAVGGYQSAHIGRAGAYGEQAAAEGMVALGFVNGHGASAFVAPFGGTARRLATNPLFVAAPTGDPDAPFVLDMATPVVAEGKVRVALNRGAELPPGSIVDGDGRPSTDPHDFYGGDPPGSRAQGALLPIGVTPDYGAGGDGGVGHKGYALALIVDLLGGALTGVGYGGRVGQLLPLHRRRPRALRWPRSIRGRARRPARLREAAPIRRGLRRDPDARRAGTASHGRAPRRRPPRRRDVASDRRGGRLGRRRAFPGAIREGG